MSNKTLTIAGAKTYKFLATSILKSDSCPEVQGLITIHLTLRTHGGQLNFFRGRKITVLFLCDDDLAGYPERNNGIIFSF